MKVKIGALMLVFLIISYFLNEQFGGSNKTKENINVMIVTGKVTNQESGNAVLRATVQIIGAPTKTFTDDNGEYSIPCNIGDELLVSHPKFKRISIEVTVETQDIQLIPKDSQLKDKLEEDFPDMIVVE